MDKMSWKSEKKEVEYKYNFRFAFTQMYLEGWLPRPSLFCAIIFYLLIATIFLVTGILIVFYSSQINNVVINDYSQNCNWGDTCDITFNIDTKLTQPINFFIQIEGYYQNHRLYLNSVNYNQIRNGEEVSKEDLSSCSPAITNGEMGKTRSINNTPLNSDEAAIPCGLVAKSFFNDEFTLVNYNISTTGISNPNDILYRYKNLSDVNEMNTKQWINIQNERLINWMNISIITNFKKLWGIINTDLNPGEYTFRIQNNWDVNSFNGKKNIELSETNLLRGKNYYLGYFYIGSAIFTYILAIFFLVYKFKNSENKIDIEWKKAK